MEIVIIKLVFQNVKLYLMYSRCGARRRGAGRVASLAPY